MKPQLVRSASKTRPLRAPEVGETKKSDIQLSGIDILEITPTRPPQLAPVKVNYLMTNAHCFIQHHVNDVFITILIKISEVPFHLSCC